MWAQYQMEWITLFAVCADCWSHVRCGTSPRHTYKQQFDVEQSHTAIVLACTVVGTGPWHLADWVCVKVDKLIPHKLVWKRLNDLTDHGRISTWHKQSLDQHCFVETVPRCLLRMDFPDSTTCKCMPQFCAIRLPWITMKGERWPEVKSYCSSHLDARR